MAITFVDSVSAGAAASTDASITTASMDTTGANLIVVGANWYGFGSASSVRPTDSNGNQYLPLTSHGHAVTDVAHRLWYCQSPTVGAGHTFTLSYTSGGGSHLSLTVAAFAGAHVSPYDLQENGTETGSAATIQPGSITPTEANCLVITSLGNFNDATFSIDGGFTIVETVAQVAAAHMGGSLAYLIQTSAAAANPTWDPTPNTGMAVVIASFKSASGTIAPVIQAEGTGTSSDTTTTNSVDTSGANFLVAVGTWDDNGSPGATISDNKSNASWQTGASYVDGGGRRITIYYHENPTVGSGHTFTLLSTGNFPGLAVGAFSGMKTSSILDQASAGAGASSTTISPGSLTPTTAHQLVITGTLSDGTSDPTWFTGPAATSIEVTPGFRIWADQVRTSGYSTTLTYRIQTAAAAANPAHTRVGTTQIRLAISASFMSSADNPGDSSLSWQGVTRVAQGKKGIVIYSGMTPPNRQE